MSTSTASPYADEDARWQAVLVRDAAADGVFWYAVRSSGIYCRPACPARRPRRANVVFFESTSAARRAGFRACRRCGPDRPSTEQQVVARVQHLLDTADPTPSLAELGAAVGFSPFHVQRLFKRATGLSPKQYAAARRAERLRGRLRDGASVTAALYDAGYGSSRALYAAARKEFGMTPGTYRDGGQGERIAYGLLDSPLGRMLVAATDTGVCALRFGDDAALLDELRREFPRATLAHDPQVVVGHAARVLAYLEDAHARLDLPLDVRASAFQERVWAALRQIPPGQTRSYAEVARLIGEPQAVRAVARACATNPVALVVPCHRVVRADGGLSGYRWGVERKRELLAREARAANLTRRAAAAPAGR